MLKRKLLVKMIIIKFQGGLGNQMFQYAFYKSLEERGFLVNADLEAYKKNVYHTGYELERIFSLNVKETSCINKICHSNKLIRFFSKILKGQKYFTENREKALKYHGWAEIEGLLEHKNIYMEGFWQTHRYFEEIRDKIIQDFKFDIFSLEENNLKITAKMKTENSISIHVRRGDFLSNKELSKCCSLEYYTKAIEYLRCKVDKAIFYVFSDDINWCKENFRDGEYIYINNAGLNSYIDMLLMSKCKHNIIANSTFSWWSAYLNSNDQKIIIAPKEFGYRIDIPENWLKF